MWTLLLFIFEMCFYSTPQLLFVKFFSEKILNADFPLFCYPIYMPSRNNVFSALALKGFSSVVVQSLLIRELLIVFYGNELTFGLILAIWLLSGAIGAGVIGNLFKNEPIKPFTFFQFIIGAAGALSLLLIRSSKTILSIPFGETFTLGHACLLALLSLAPVALCDGALFNIGFRLFSQVSKRKESAVAKIYLWECLGTICGGIIFTFIMLSLLNSFEIVLIVSLLNILCANLLLLKEPNRPYRALMAILFIVALGLLFLAPKIQSLTLKTQWEDKELINYKNSVYGNIATLRDSGQYTVYYDGLPSATIPTPETYFTEDFAHFALLSRPESKKILFIGNAVGGLIRETLKYPVSKAVYVEIDPAFLKTINDLKEPETEKELSDPRVRVVLQDARNFTKTTKEKFDIIYVNTGLPTSLALNRYYTEEFYREISSSLNDSGIAVFKTWGSLAYLSEELKHSNAVMIKTLSRVFPEIYIVPGDGFNIFLASKIKQDFNPYILGARLKHYNILTHLINTEYLKLRFQKPYLDWFITNMSNEIKRADINSDLKPAGLYEGLSLYYSQFSKKIPNLIGGFKKIKPQNLVFYIIAFFIFWRWKFRHAKTLGASYGLTIFTTGAYCLATQITVLFLFQSFFGNLFQWLAILTASFMAGASAGAFLADRKIKFFKNPSKIVRVEIALPVLTTFLILSAVFFFYRAASAYIIRWLFSLISISAGFMVGLELPIIFELYKHTRKIHHTDFSKAAGMFYCLDLLGACAGAIATPLILIPNCGIIATTQVLLLIKAANATTLWMLSRE